MKDDNAIIIPAGKYHEVTNNGTEELKLYTLYSPPQHSPNLTQKNMKMNWRILMNLLSGTESQTFYKLAKNKT